jgi:hypothetical protein
LFDAALGVTIPFEYGYSSVGLHVMKGFVSPSNCSDGSVVSCYKVIPERPRKKTRFMHARVGKAPKRIGFIANEMGGRDNKIARIDDNPTNRTLSLATQD